MHRDREIDHLHPDFRKKVLRLANDLEYEKIEVWLNEGYRSPDLQEDYYAQGRTRPGPIITNAHWWQSHHPFGRAIDLYPVDADGRPIFDFDPTKPPWPRIVQIAKLRGMAWGGNWKKFKDYPHFQDANSPPLWLLRIRHPRGWRK